MMKKKIDKKGILFWITGLPGSEKQQLPKKYYHLLKKGMVLQYI